MLMDRGSRGNPNITEPVILSEQESRQRGDDGESKDPDIVVLAMLLQGVFSMLRVRMLQCHIH
jgi:hypothetical protein